MSRITKFILFFPFVLLLCISLGVGYLYVNQRNMMYHPDKARPDATAWEVSGGQVITVKTEDGLDIEGWYFAPHDKDVFSELIIFFHGNTGSHAARAEKIRSFIDEGYGVMLAGYRGYGGNPGEPTEQGLYKDARAAVNYAIQELIYPSREIILYGESLGSGVAVQMAAEFDVKALVLEAPYTSTIDVARLKYWFLPLELLMQDQYRSVDKVEKIVEPVLILHGREDTVIPFTQGQNLFNAFLYRSPSSIKLFMPYDEGTHNNLYDYDAALHVVKFLRSIKSDTPLIGLN